MTCPNCERMREALVRLKAYIETPRTDSLYTDLTGVRSILRDALAPASEPQSRIIGEQIRIYCADDDLLKRAIDALECEFAKPAVPAPVFTPPVDDDAVERMAKCIARAFGIDLASGEPDGRIIACHEAARAAIAAMGEVSDRKVDAACETCGVPWIMDADSARRVAGVVFATCHPITRDRSVEVAKAVLAALGDPADKRSKP